MKIHKTLSFYLLFVVLVFIFWAMIGITSVLTGEVIGIRPGGLILGLLGFFAVKWAWSLAWKLIKKQRGKDEDD